MISLYTIFTIIIIHYLADFVFQTHWMASNKSKSNIALGCHVGVYSLGLLAIGLLNIGSLGLIGLVLWFMVNAAAHFATDYFTSRASSKHFGGNWHKFFEIIGGDQSIHYLTLFTTFCIFN